MIRLTREQYPFLNPPEHLSLFSVAALKRLISGAHLEIIHINTYDVVTHNSVWRGIGRLLGRSWNSYRNQWAGYITKMISRGSQPFLWSLGRLGLGSQIEVYTRKQGDKV